MTEKAAAAAGGLLRPLLIADHCELLISWDAFVQNTLHAILDHQIVGSYSALANLSGVSQVLLLNIDL